MGNIKSDVNKSRHIKGSSSCLHSYFSVIRAAFRNINPSFKLLKELFVFP